MAWLAWLTIVVILSSTVKSHEWVPARPPVGHFAVTDAENTTCLLMTVGMTFHVPYVKNDSKNTEEVASYYLPADADVTGSCEDTAASITLSWGEGFNVTVSFQRNDTMFYGSDITTGYVLNRDVFPDCKDDGETRVQSGPPHDVHAMPGRSYLCDVAVNVTVGNVTVTFSDLQVQPFLVKGGNFSKAEECAADMATTPSAHTIPVKTTVHTTPIPFPVPKPSQNNYTLTDITGKVCFMALMAVQIQVNYTRTTGKTGSAVWDVPKNTNATGACGNDTASLQLVFDGGLTNLTVIFTATTGMDDLTDVDTDSGFKASEMFLEYVETEARFPGSVNNGTSQTVEKKNLAVFQCTTGMSYKCNTRQTVMLSHDVTLRFEDVHLQPFQVKGGHFDPVKECTADKVTTPGPSNMTTPMTAITTPPPPRPVHDPITLNFTLTDDENKICFMALMGVQIEVNYTTHDTEKKSTARWNVPNSVTVTGECSNTTATLTLTFDGELTVVTMTFRNQSGKGGTVNKFMVSDIDLQYVTDKSHFPDAQPAELGKHINISKHNLAVFKGELGSSYLCKKGDNVTLNQNVTLRMIEVQVQPFGLTSNKFDQAEVCEADNDVSTLRPIIVGCAIAGVDVLMLLYYGIGRRMRRNKNTR
ncbi:PREDICTED: lysosome-associated membrane glycoprotein 1-like [Branchiostoma belcheri]|uniref:Lysosome-associated membrane glycoprotein 1-like n=1 Tax=Branchiostoma belcheri TaxID=7741 RepID=A0A6P5AWT0_BRABE|nr:PREDICTED: lysosome-associated membrane glycoprotein 1-like [Branchiostoma belcheri]